MVRSSYRSIAHGSVVHPDAHIHAVAVGAGANAGTVTVVTMTVIPVMVVGAARRHVGVPFAVPVTGDVHRSGPVVAVVVVVMTVVAVHPVHVVVNRAVRAVVVDVHVVATERQAGHHDGGQDQGGATHRGLLRRPMLGGSRPWTSAAAMLPGTRPARTHAPMLIIGAGPGPLNEAGPVRRRRARRDQSRAPMQ